MTPAPRYTTLACSALVPALLVTACGDEDSLLTRSCRGEAVPNCRPFEYSVVESASLTPDGLSVSDFGAEAHIVVRLQMCGAQTPTPHEVVIRALAASPDVLADGGGDSVAVYTLLTLGDNGMDGDAVAKDGMIDVMRENPFGPEVPADRSMTLRFEARILPSCVGQAFEVGYRTGERFSPDAGL